MRIIVIPLAVLALTAGTSLGVTTDFEGFTPGSVNGQGGWTVVDQWGNDAWGNTGTAFDQAVVDDGTGNMVWRVSNAVTSGGKSAQPFSASAPQVAGEPGAALWNDYGDDHTQPARPPFEGAMATTNTFYGAFTFASTTGAAQPGLAMSVSPAARQVDGRMSYVKMVDNGSTGFDMFFYQTGHTNDIWGTNGSDAYVQIASGLSYAQAHSVEMYVEFNEGLREINGEMYGNDVVNVLIDGELVHTGTTWETFFYGANPYGSGDLHAVDSLTFSLGGTAVPATMGEGLFIDNVAVTNDAYAAPVPEPVTVLTMLGSIGALGRYVRRRTA